MEAAFEQRWMRKWRSRGDGWDRRYEGSQDEGRENAHLLNWAVPFASKLSLAEGHALVLAGTKLVELMSILRTKPRIMAKEGEM